MLLLGLDTSTSCGSIALTDANKPLGEWTLNVPKTHAGRLLPGIQHLLRQTGVQMDQIDGFAVATGPGSFTGLRIALTTAKTLAFVTGKPLVGIPTLDVLVENMPFAQGFICPALDARKGEIFAALYKKDSTGKTDRITEYLSIPPETLSKMIPGPTLLLGDAVPVYGDRLRRECSHEITHAPPEYHFPRASILCRLAIKKLSQGGAVHPRDLQALYARASDAELNRKG
jgi:tRNA threonylcarbamoyladenosine biosynthesis protein TsaB